MTAKQANRSFRLTLILWIVAALMVLFLLNTVTGGLSSGSRELADIRIQFINSISGGK